MLSANESARKDFPGSPGVLPLVYLAPFQGAEKGESFSVVCAYAPTTGYYLAAFQAAKHTKR
jgi:hypothetical protein